jgi:hypothetical protein
LPHRSIKKLANATDYQGGLCCVGVMTFSGVVRRTVTSTDVYRTIKILVLLYCTFVRGKRTKKRKRSMDIIEVLKNISRELWIGPLSYVGKD